MKFSKSVLLTFLLWLCFYNIWSQTYTSKEGYVFSINDKKIISLLNQLESVKTTNVNDSEKISKKLLELVIKKNNNKLIAYCYNSLAKIELVKQDYKMAAFFLNKSKSISKNINDKKIEYENYKLSGRLNYFENNEDNSLKNYKQAYKYSSNKKDSLYIDLLIARIYQANDQFEVAKLMLKDIINYYESQNIVNEISIKANLSFIPTLDDIKDFDEKLNIVDNAIKDSKKIKNSFLESTALLTKGHIYYFRFNHDDLALSYFLKSFQLSKQNGDVKDLMKSLFMIITLKTHLKDYMSASKYIDTLTIYRPKVEGTLWFNKITDSLKFAVYTKSKEYKKATIHAEKYISNIYSTLRDNKNKDYIEFGRKYEAEKKAKENKLLKMELEMKNLKLAKEKNLKQFFILLIILIVSFLILTGIQYFRKKKLAALLKTQNKIILNQAQELDVYNKTKNKLFATISHDLRNSFNSMLWHSRILESDFEVLSDNEKEKYIRKINKGVDLNYRLASNLLEWSKIQLKKISVVNEKLNIEFLIEDVVEQFVFPITRKEIIVKRLFESNLIITTDKQLLKTILKNIIHNAIKYSNQKGEMIIKTEVDENEMIISIRDYGVGIKEDILDNVFVFNEVKSTEGTLKEKGSGLGLIISNELVKYLKGYITIEKLDFGTIVRIFIPVKI